MNSGLSLGTEKGISLSPPVHVACYRTCKCGDFVVVLNKSYFEY